MVDSSIMDLIIDKACASLDAIWRSDLSESPTGRDLSRLVNTFSVYKELFEATKDELNLANEIIESFSRLTFKDNLFRERRSNINNSSNNNNNNNNGEQHQRSTITISSAATHDDDANNNTNVARISTNLLAYERIPFARRRRETVDISASASVPPSSTTTATTDADSASSSAAKNTERQALAQKIVNLLNALHDFVHKEGEEDRRITLEQFNAKVNLQDHPTVTDFLREHYGENGKVTKILKLCNQSVVLALITVIRLTLAKAGINFKDARGAHWFLIVKKKTYTQAQQSLLEAIDEDDLTTITTTTTTTTTTATTTDDDQNQHHHRHHQQSQQSQTTATVDGDVICLKETISITHRRKEHCFKLTGPSGNMLKGTFQFEWEVEIQFDSTDIEAIQQVSLRLLPTSFDWSKNEVTDMTPEQMQAEENEFKKRFYDVTRTFTSPEEMEQLKERVSQIRAKEREEEEREAVARLMASRKAVAGDAAKAAAARSGNKKEGEKGGHKRSGSSSGGSSGILSIFSSVSGTSDLSSEDDMRVLRLMGRKELQQQHHHHHQK